MKKITTPAALRVTAVTVGALLLTAAGAAAANAADPVGDDSTVDVTVEVSELTGPGALAMTVAADSVALTESGSTELVRQFTGTLPTVTVTDTRAAEDIPADAAWYVLGSSTDFAGDAGQPAIGAGHLGWAPALIDGGESGLVAAGDEVDTVIDDDADPANNVGLVDQELLASAWNSGEIVTEGSWTANAGLFLRTESTVAAGNYSSTLTLSLFE